MNLVYEAEHILFEIFFTDFSYQRAVLDTRIEQVSLLRKLD